MFRARKYRRQVAHSLTAGLDVICAQVGASVTDDRTRVLLEMTARTQRDTLQDFAARLRGEEGLQGFVSAMQLPDPAFRALRIATWALVIRLARSRLGRRYSGVVDAALPALGVDSEWEHRLVYFEPTAVPEMQSAQFDRYTLEGMVAASTGSDDPGSLPWTVLWASEMTGAYQSLTAAMDVLDPEPPQPGFSRLSEVEAEIKARQQADSQSE